MKPRVSEVIVVEGRYDRHAVCNAVEATVLETAGFHVFKDRELVALLRRLAKQRGIILLTDSDGAGFVIRGYLKGAVSEGTVRQAYIPDRYGKESRKSRRSKEGKLGVEGMPPEVILNALRQAGATFDGDAPQTPERTITKLDLYRDGLSGRQDSAARRALLAQELELPARMSANALVEAMQLLCGYEGYRAAVDRLFGESKDE